MNAAATACARNPSFELITHMGARATYRQAGLATSLVARWDELCDRYLRIADEQSLWRSSRSPSTFDPEQGWKLHVAATVLTANTVLERLGPFLHSSGTLFKGPRSLEELGRINCGLFHGYTQVGKCFTVYPANDLESVELARRLHELTLGLGAPSVPFDERFCPGSSVYYRYGSFKRRSIQTEDGTQTLVISDPAGNLIPDLRESSSPAWVTNPFSNELTSGKDQSLPSPRKTSVRVFRALAQRGKGGVYQAVDLSGTSPSLCIVKQGRKHGEVAWDGRDGYWRVREEKRALNRFRRRGIRVPRLYSSFEADDSFYLVLEYIKGKSLEGLLRSRSRRLPLLRSLQFGFQVAKIMSGIHSAGWVWRDCKPANLIVAEGDELRPLDFEGSCKIGAKNPAAWGTQSFLPAVSKDIEHQSQPSADLYSLGVVIYYLLTGSLPSAENPVAIGKLRRGVPLAVSQIVSDLMSPHPHRRPSAWAVAQRLADILSSSRKVTLRDRYVLRGRA